MDKQYPRRTLCLLMVLAIAFFLGACQKQFISLPTESNTPVTANPYEINTTLPNDHQQEYLIIWGQEELPNGDCMFLAVDTETYESSRSTVEVPWCNYAVLNLSDMQRLISFPPYHPSNGTRSSEIIVYEINQDGILSQTQTIFLDGLRLTDTPQGGRGNIIYFSAIKDNQEGIYRYDGNAQMAIPYITTETGFATSPVISSDGRYIAYQVWEDHENKEHNSRDDCGQLTCFSRFLHVWDVESNTDLDLAPLIAPLIAGESYFSHCEPEWSSTDNLLAFNVGCEFQTPSSIVVFDPSKNNVPIVINPVGNRSISKFQWVEGNRLILNGAANISGQDVVNDGYLVYSASTNTLEQMTGLPESNTYDYDLVYFSDWTNDAEFAVGYTLVPSDTRTINIVIANSWNDSPEETYIQSPNLVVDDLKWSQTNTYVAYHTYNHISENESRFMIIDVNGLTIFDSGMVEVVFPKLQWYTQP